MSDWSGMKFKIAEDLGDCMDCTYVKYDPTLKNKRFSILHHADHDGVSALTHLLEKEGFEVVAQPQLRDGENPPGFWEKLKCLWGYIQLTKPVPFKWKREKLDMTGVSHGFSFNCFDVDTSLQIIEYCKSRKISLTVFLMSTLDKVVARDLLEQGSVRKWFAPINMRGGVVSGRAMGNFSASIIINADDSFGERRWHQELVGYLKKRLHWGAWLYTNMARFIGVRGTRYVARKVKDVGVGVFSNLGQWPDPGVKEPENFEKNMVIIPAAPASQVLPVAAVSSIWYDQLALTVRIHPSLQLSLAECKGVHLDWLEEIYRRVGIEDDIRCEFIERESEYN